MLTSVLLAAACCGGQLTPSLSEISFMPKNDLHLEDVYFKSNAGEEVFNKIIDIAKEEYQDEADANNERLIINKRWSDSTVNANVSRRWGTVYINMYGGLYRRPEVTPEAFALVVCHELGHAYGGRPYIAPSARLSAEGQSDYYGARSCLRRVMQHFEESPESIGMDLPYAEEVCEEDDEECARGLKAGFGLGWLLQVLMDEPRISYETPDEVEVDQMELSYPKTVQCRLDTYRAGILDEPRPRCWFKP